MYLTDNTAAPYNVITGYASTNVPAYSNGNDSHTSNEWNFLYGVFTGMKWQCVEYARRWLFIRKGCVFDSIDGAKDIWNLTIVQRVVDKKCFTLKSHPNGSPYRPQNESLLIYKGSTPDIPFGHVAVIVDVLPDAIRVAEENYNPYYWTGNYAREIPYVFRNGSYFIDDYYSIFGWMTVEDNNETKPLDQSTIDIIQKLNGTSPDFICQNNARKHYLSIFFLTISLLLSLLRTKNMNV